MVARCARVSVDRRQFRDTIRAAESSALRAAEKLMDAGIRETQAKLSIIRRELKRRKRAGEANELLKDGWTP